MPVAPCKPGCRCGKHLGHQGRSCLPGCTCRRHGRLPSRAVSEAVKQQHARGLLARKCEPGCKCRRHDPEVLAIHREQNLARRAAGVYRSRETVPEKQMEKMFRDADVAYVKQFRIFKYSVDFYLPEHNIVVEVNGCWWHRCKRCGFKDDARARFRDGRRWRSIRSRGFELVVVWEHELEGLGV